MIVQYRFKTKKGTDRNPEQILVIPGFIPALERNIINKGFSKIDCELIFEHPIHESEREYINSLYRVSYTKYHSWEQLIMDESDLWGKDHPFVKALERYKEKYPYDIRGNGHQLKLNL